MERERRTSVAVVFIIYNSVICGISRILLTYNFSRIFSDRDSLLAGALNLASTIASKSPVAVQGTKMALVYARDHSVADSLNQVVSAHKDIFF